MSSYLFTGHIPQVRIPVAVLQINKQDQKCVLPQPRYEIFLSIKGTLLIWFSYLNQSKSDFSFIGPVECDLNVLIWSGEIIWFSYLNQSKTDCNFIGPVECDHSVKQTSPPCLIVVLSVILTLIGMVFLSNNKCSHLACKLDVIVESRCALRSNECNYFCLEILWEFPKNSQKY